MEAATAKAGDTATGEKADTAEKEEGKAEKGAPLEANGEKAEASAVKGARAQEKAVLAAGLLEEVIAKADAGKADSGKGRAKAVKNVHLAPEKGAHLAAENAENTVIGREREDTAEKEEGKAENAAPLAEAKEGKASEAGRGEKVDSAPAREGKGAHLAENAERADSEAEKGEREAATARERAVKNVHLAGARGAPLEEKAQAKEGLTAPNS